MTELIDEAGQKQDMSWGEWSPTGSYIVTSNDFAGAAAIWTGEGKLLKHLGRAEVPRNAWSHNGKYLVVYGTEF